MIKNAPTHTFIRGTEQGLRSAECLEVKVIDAINLEFKEAIIERDNDKIYELLLKNNAKPNIDEVFEFKKDLQMTAL